MILEEHFSKINFKGEIYVRPNFLNKLTVQQMFPKFAKKVRQSEKWQQVWYGTVAVVRICFQISFIQHHFNVELKMKNHPTNPN